MAIASSSASAQPAAGPSVPPPQKLSSPAGFDVIASYKRALEDEKVAHPIAAITALVELMEASTAATVAGLSHELTAARKLLTDTQPSLGVHAGCQLWERFFALSHDDDRGDFPQFKLNLIGQGRNFCKVTAPQCRERIADLTKGFLRDDCTILTHSYSRTVAQALLHAQNKRVKVYVTEARPGGLGLKTHRILTAAGIPCIVVLDSAVAYVMERVDMVLVGSEAVVESGGLISSVGTYQLALVAKAMQKPFYALAESYKFLRHYPLSQTDLPVPRTESTVPLAFPGSKAVTTHAPSQSPLEARGPTDFYGQGQKDLPDAMTQEMLKANPLVDVTTPDLIDFIITDLGAPLSPTSVSQYLVAQFN